jgi:hypothetical protein
MPFSVSIGWILKGAVENYRDRASRYTLALPILRRFAIADAPSPSFRRHSISAASIVLGRAPANPSLLDGLDALHLALTP